MTVGNTVITLLAICQALILAEGLEHHDEPTVRTRSGVLVGKMVQSPQQALVQEYLGIPFAEPPVGVLRYADPVPIGRFPQDPYPAQSLQFSCFQPLDKKFGDFEGSDMWNAPNPLSEDCLYMNVWVPEPRKQNTHVMVWIYGGGFYSGSDALWVYDGRALAAHGDVIIVDFNYRIGSLGFLATGDGRIKGNFGLKDQFVALQWIKDNIGAFGGDPDSITLFGESAGAASVGFHLLNPRSDHLFNRAIMASGSPSMDCCFMTPQQAKVRSRSFLQAVGCDISDHDEVLTCLRRLPVNKIRDTEWVTKNFLEFPWAPTVDGDFLMDTPYRLLQQGKFQKKDAILGVNKDEGTFWLLYNMPDMTKSGPSLQNHSNFLHAVDLIVWDVDPGTKDDVLDLYSPDDPDDLEANRDELDNLSGDRNFICPVTSWADVFSQSVDTSTYFYQLTYRASTERWGEWMGVVHGADCQWYFGMPLNTSRGYTEEEETFSKTIMSYWVNFAKTGDPNGPTLPEWPQYKEGDRQFLEWKGPSEFRPRSEFSRDVFCDFWRSYEDEMKGG